MQRIVSAILFVCFGVLAPLQASPVRLCVRENRVLPGPGSCSFMAGSEHKCCNACKLEQEPQQNPDGDCCVEVESLPNGTVPAPPVTLPVFTLVALPAIDEWLCLLRPVLIHDEYCGLPPPVPIPASVASRRAMLNVWRI